MRTLIVSSLLALSGGVLLLGDAFGFPSQVDEEVPSDPRVDAAEAAEESLKYAELLHRTGRLSEYHEGVYIWSRRLAEARLTLTSEKDERLAVINEHLKRTENLLQQARARHEVGIANHGPLEVAEAEYFLAEARIMLQNEQDKSAQ